MTVISFGSGGLPIFWGLMGASFWILLIVGIVLLVRGMRTTTSASGGPVVRLLEERYARGEITREEFLEGRDVLLEGPPEPRTTTRNRRARAHRTGRVGRAPTPVPLRANLSSATTG